MIKEIIVPICVSDSNHLFCSSISSKEIYPINKCMNSDGCGFCRLFKRALSFSDNKKLIFRCSECVNAQAHLESYNIALGKV
jgi:hypothetical protein